MKLARTPYSGRHLLGLAGWLFAAPLLAAQGKVDAALAQRYGGVLAADCANYLMPKLRYLGDSIDVQEGGKTVLVARNLRAAPDHFGATPPAGFENAVTGTVAGGEAMVFVFYRSPGGLFASVEGGPKVMAALPASLKGKRVRHCDPNRNLAPGASPPVEVGPAEMLKDATFRQSWVKALGPLAKERWLMQLDGPAPPVKTVRVAGETYQLVSVCKNHDCADNNLVLLWALPSRVIYAKVLQRRQPLLVGSPPPAMAAELDRLWKAEWRAGK